MVPFVLFFFYLNSFFTSVGFSLCQFTQSSRVMSSVAFSQGARGARGAKGPTGKPGEKVSGRFPLKHLVGQLLTAELAVIHRDCKMCAGHHRTGRPPGILWGAGELVGLLRDSFAFGLLCFTTWLFPRYRDLKDHKEEMENQVPKDQA